MVGFAAFEVAARVLLAILAKKMFFWQLKRVLTSNRQQKQAISYFSSKETKPKHVDHRLV